MGIMIGEARDTPNLSRAVRSCFRLGLRLVTIRLVTRNMTRLYPTKTLAAKYSVNFLNSQAAPEGVSTGDVRFTSSAALPSAPR